MSNAPFNASHLKYRYRPAIPPGQRSLRPEIDDGLFHHGEVDATLDVINEVANQLGLDGLWWCHFMEDTLRQELRGAQSREEILCGLHERIAAQLFHEHAGPRLHR
ncbi:MAG: hypothetical protein K0R03_1731 [Moraxellaceae bacterium]|jgi:hypothetical protein|nr:hypothetical protein [Moraxellaceae bacterium]